MHVLALLFEVIQMVSAVMHVFTQKYLFTKIKKIPQKLIVIKVIKSLKPKSVTGS